MLEAFGILGSTLVPIGSLGDRHHATYRQSPFSEPSLVRAHAEQGFLEEVVRVAKHSTVCNGMNLDHLLSTR